MPTPLQTVVASFQVTAQFNNVLDVWAYWLDQFSAVAGLLASDINETDTILTLAPLSADPNSATPIIFPNSGDMILIDNEPIYVNSVDVTAKTVQIARIVPTLPYLAIMPITIQLTHKASSKVNILKHTDPYTMIVDESVMPYIKGIIDKRGKKAFTFSTVTVGSLTVPTS